jgi:hypothetical protein
MTTAQIRAIEKHGRQLQAIFPATAEMDPIELCRKLRRLEAQAAAFALRLCNGPEFESEDAQERIKERILDRVDNLLDFRADGVPVFLNQDPRGYSLKIRAKYVQEKQLAIHRDWGGYGILAPEIDKDGN